MKLDPRVGEGRRRLRIVSVLFTTLVTYLLFCLVSFDGWYWNGWYLTFVFPALSAVAGLGTYVIVTAVYWVLDGFDTSHLASTTTILNPNRPQLPSSDVLTVREDSQKARDIADHAIAISDKVHAFFVETAALNDATSRGPMASLLNVVFDAWKWEALVFAVGLVYISEILRNSSFIESDVEREATAIVKEALRALNRENSRLAGIKSKSPSVTKDITLGAVQNLWEGISSFTKEKAKGGRSPLFRLSTYVLNEIGMESNESVAALSSFGEKILQNLNGPHDPLAKFRRVP